MSIVLSATASPSETLVNLLMLFVGCFLDAIAAITILVPILLPIVVKFGIDPVHFGLITFIPAITLWPMELGLIRAK